MSLNNVVHFQRRDSRFLPLPIHVILLHNVILTVLFTIKSHNDNNNNSNINDKRSLNKYKYLGSHGDQHKGNEEFLIDNREAYIRKSKPLKKKVSLRYISRFTI